MSDTPNGLVESAVFSIQLPACTGHGKKCQCDGHKKLRTDEAALKGSATDEIWAEYGKAKKSAARAYRKHLEAATPKEPKAQTPSGTSVAGLAQAAREMSSAAQAGGKCARCNVPMPDISMPAMLEHQKHCGNETAEPAGTTPPEPEGSPESDATPAAPATVPDASAEAPEDVAASCPCGTDFVFFGEYVAHACDWHNEGDYHHTAPETHDEIGSDPSTAPLPQEVAAALEAAETEPVPTLVVLPTGEEAKAFTEERLAPVLKEPSEESLRPIAEGAAALIEKGMAHLEEAYQAELDHWKAEAAERARLLEERGPIEGRASELLETMDAECKKLSGELMAKIEEQTKDLQERDHELTILRSNTPRPTRVDENGAPLSLPRAFKRDMEAILYTQRPEGVAPAYPRASSLGKGCTRRLAWELLGQPARGLDLDLRGVFSRGDVWEEEYGRRSRFMGWGLDRTQEAFEYRDPEDPTQILWRGHWDGVLSHASFDVRAPVDFKSCSDRIWRSIWEDPEHGAAALLKSEFQHLRGYVYQMNGYLWPSKYPWGVLVFINSETGLPKVVMVPRDTRIRDELIEASRSAIGHADRIRTLLAGAEALGGKSIRAWDMPQDHQPPATKNLKTCKRCPFNGVSCWPRVEIKGDQVVTGPAELIDAVLEMVGKKSARGDYQRLKETVRPRFINMPDAKYHVPGVDGAGATVTIRTNKDGTRVMDARPVTKKEESKA